MLFPSHLERRFSHKINHSLNNATFSTMYNINQKFKTQFFGKTSKKTSKIFDCYYCCRVINLKIEFNVNRRNSQVLPFMSYPYNGLGDTQRYLLIFPSRYTNELFLRVYMHILYYMH